MSKKIDTLENNTLWQQANEIAEYMYSIVDKLPAEENWNTKSKLRIASGDLIFDLAQALGGAANPAAAKYAWVSARKQLFALKTMYRFSYKQHYVDMDPDVMVKIEKLVDETDEQIERCGKQAEKETEAQVKSWLKKYEVWKEMNQ